MIPLFLGVLAGWETFELRRAGPWRYTFRGKIVELGKSFGEKNWGNIAKTPRELVGERNVKAFLAVIREKESRGNYSVICGGGEFSSFADHPRPKLPKPCTKGAAGAYQFTIATWDGVRAAMKLTDFKPASQDLAALGFIAYRGALPAVLDGRFDEAAKKCNGGLTGDGWTSLPGGREDSWKLAGGLPAARAFFVKQGGKLAVSG
jgi:muramidase (phage lysozyme)